MRKPLLMALGLSGLALFATMRSARKVSEQLNRTQQKKDLGTWENEGGTPVPPSTATTSAPTTPTANPATEV